MSKSINIQQKMLMEFYYNLSTEKRKQKGIPENLCEKGKTMFENFCEDPFKHTEFLHHFGVRPEHGGCKTCHDAFFEYLESALDFGLD
jgi:hypothetical protein